MFPSNRNLALKELREIEAEAKKRLEGYKGVLGSLTHEQRRAIAEMDPGPTASIGVDPGV